MKTWMARNTDGMDAFILVRSPFKKNAQKKITQVILSSVLFAERYDNPNWQVAPLNNSQADQLLSQYKLNELYDAEPPCQTSTP